MDTRVKTRLDLLLNGHEAREERRSLGSEEGTEMDRVFKKTPFFG